MLLAFALTTLVSSQSAPPEDPRLIVLVSVDQMIPEQLRRLEPWFRGGLKRFLEAEVWENAYHAHALSDTAPGHATLGTGCHPARHGVIANTWLSAETGGVVYCVGDPGARKVGSGGLGASPASSPATLLRPGIADYLKAHDEGSLAVSIAGKDRAAILSAGRDVDLALWWDRPIGGFASSDHYVAELPDWVAAWNRDWASRAGRYVWKRLPGDLDGSGTAPDERPGEPRGRRTFPHPAPVPENDPAALGRFVFSSPLIDLYALELAGEALERFGLGRDESTDYLFVGLSACDTVGHAYGPYSQEVTDVILRVDRELGSLFERLDAEVGEGRWIAALSSDHGVLELPESLRAKGVPASRSSLATSGAAVQRLGAALDERFGAGILQGAGWRGLRFAHDRLAELGVEAALVEEHAKELLAEVDFIERIFTRTELEAWSEDQLGIDPLRDLMARAYHPERSWDLTFVFVPGKVFQGSGTSHGSPWAYDRRVPVCFLGPGHRPGRFFEDVLVADVCPTLLDRAGIAVPQDLDGIVLKR